MNDTGRELLDAGWEVQEDTVGLSYLFGVLRRQFFVLFLTPMIFLMAGLAYLVTAEPLFTATATLYVRLDQSGQTDDLSQLNTHAELLQTGRITSLVIDELGLAEIFKPTTGRLRQAIGDARRWLELETGDSWKVADRQPLLISQVQDGLSVERVGNSTMINIDYTSPERALSVDIANTFAAIYVKDVVGESDRLITQRKAALQDRAEQVRILALSAQNTARKLISQSNYIVTSAKGLDDRIAAFHQQLSDSSANEAEVRARISLISQASGVDSLPASALQEDETLKLYSVMLSASKKLELYRQQSGVSTDTLERLEESIEGMRASLERAVRHIRDDLELELAVIAARNLAIQRDLNAIQEYGGSTEWANLLKAQREAETFERIYQQNLDELENVHRSDASHAIKLVSKALPPVSPSFPKYKVMLVLIVTFGILVGAALAMAREWASRSAQRPGQFVRTRLRLRQ